MDTSWKSSRRIRSPAGGAMDLRDVWPGPGQPARIARPMPSARSRNPNDLAGQPRAEKGPKLPSWQASRAREKGDGAPRRHELLGLRYGENLAIREIAARWEVDVDWLHVQCRRARREFRSALEEVVRELQGGDSKSIETECRELQQHFR